MKLTQSFINTIEPSDKPFLLNADLPKGFAVKVYPTGIKTYIFRYRFTGKSYDYVLGKHGNITLAQAHKLALDAAFKAASGINPQEQKKEAVKEAKKQEIIDKTSTIDYLCNLYLTDHAIHKKTFKEDKRLIDKLVLPRFTGQKFNEISRTEYKDFLITLAEPTNKSKGNKAIYKSNRVHSLLSTIYNFGIKLEIVTITNPIKFIKKYPEEHRTNFIPTNRFNDVIDSIDREPDIFLRNYFKILMATGLRKNELLTSLKCNLDFDRNTLSLFNTKNGTNFNVFLTDYIKGLLKELPNNNSNKFIFQGKALNGCLSDIDRGWKRITSRCKGLEEIHIHDIRRSFATLALEQGTDTLVISKLLNQKSTAMVNKVYAQVQNESKQNAMNGISNVFK